MRIFHLMQFAPAPLWVNVAPDARKVRQVHLKCVPYNSRFFARDPNSRVNKKAAASAASAAIG